MIKEQRINENEYYCRGLNGQCSLKFPQDIQRHLDAQPPGPRVMREIAAVDSIAKEISQVIDGNSKRVTVVMNWQKMIIEDVIWEH